MKDNEIVYSCLDLDTGRHQQYTVADLKGLCNLLVCILTTCEDEQLAEECLCNIQCCDTFYDEDDEEYEFCGGNCNE